jgi:hypothetical protein
MILVGLLRWHACMLRELPSWELLYRSYRFGPLSILQGAKSTENFSHPIRTYLTPHVGPTRQVAWWQKDRMTIEIKIWGVFLKNIIFYHPYLPTLHTRRAHHPPSDCEIKKIEKGSLSCASCRQLNTCVISDDHGRRGASRPAGSPTRAWLAASTADARASLLAGSLARPRGVVGWSAWRPCRVRACGVILGGRWAYQSPPSPIQYYMCA